MQKRRIVLVFVLLAGFFLTGFWLQWAAWQTSQPAQAASLAGVTRYVDASGTCSGHMPCYNHPQLAADAASPGDVLLLQDDIFTGVFTVNFNTQVLYLDKNLTVIGGYDDNYREPPYRSTVLLPQPANRVVMVDGPTAVVTLSNLTLTGGDASWGGTALYVYGGEATLRNSVVTDNYGRCAAIGADMSPLLTIENSTIYSNTSYGSLGTGAICMWDARTGSRVAFNEIYSNTAEETTAIYLMNSDVVIDANKIYANVASTGRSAGILLDGGSYTLTNNYFGKNVSAQPPSALAATNSSTLMLMHNTFNGNGTAGTGETILIESSTGTMYNNIISTTESMAVLMLSGNNLAADTNLFFNVDIPITATGGGAFTNLTPFFVDPQFDLLIPYAISPDSPAEGVGLPEFVDHDIDGRLRPLGTGPDLGAMEAAATQIISTTQDEIIDLNDPSGLTTTLFVPANTFALCGNVEFHYSAFMTPGHFVSDTIKYAGRAFDLSLVCGPRSQYDVYLPFVARASSVVTPSVVLRPDAPLAAMQQLASPVTVTLGYSDEDILGIDEETLALYYWNGQKWIDAASTCPVPVPYQHDPDTNQIAAAVCHLSEFILGGH